MGVHPFARVIRPKGNIMMRPEFKLAYYDVTKQQADNYIWGILLKHGCPDGLGCRIHRLHLCRGVRPPSEYLGYDTKQCCLGYDTKQGSSDAGGLGNAEHPFIGIAPRSTLDRRSNT